MASEFIRAIKRSQSSRNRTSDNMLGIVSSVSKDGKTINTETFSGAEIRQLKLILPYGISSGARNGMRTQVTRNQHGDDTSYGVIDNNRPKVGAGNTMLYNSSGLRVYLEGGKLLIKGIGVDITLDGGDAIIASTGGTITVGADGNIALEGAASSMIIDPAGSIDIEAGGGEVTISRGANTIIMGAASIGLTSGSSIVTMGESNINMTCGGGAIAIDSSGVNVTGVLKVNNIAVDVP